MSETLKMETHLLTLLLIILLSVNPSKSGNPGDTLPTCDVTLTDPLPLPPYYERTYQGKPVPVTLTHREVSITAPPGVLECRLDTSQFLDHVTVTGQDAELSHVSISLICPEARTFQLILEHTSGIKNNNAIGELEVVFCKLFWKHIALYGRALDLWRLDLVYWKDQFEEELERYGSPPKRTVYDDGLENISRLEIIHPFVDPTSETTTVPFPRILRDYAWPQMARIMFDDVPYVSISRGVINTMPHLQFLEFQGGHLIHPPDFFPWDHSSMKLPRHVSRTFASNHKYIREAIVQPDQYHRNLYLDWNVITDLSDFEFQGSLDAITLKGNNLTTLGVDTFRHTQHLKFIDLSFNRIEFFPGGVFHGLDELERLILKYNMLVSLPSELFRDLSALLSLDLAHNTLVTFSVEFFSYLPSLQEISLRSNNLTRLDEHVSLISERLVAVDFSKNRLSSIPSWVFLMHSLRDINLGNNHLSFKSVRSAFDRISLDVMNQWELEHLDIDIPLRTVKLRENHFTTIPLELEGNEYDKLSWMMTYFRFDVTDNPMTCDCLAFKNFLLRLQETDIGDLWTCRPTMKQCTGNLSHCPPKCHCHERSVDKVKVVDCQNQNLTTVPEQVPPGTQVIHLDNNAISQVVTTHTYFANLTKFTLSKNNVSTISISALKAMGKLTHLEIQDNKLQRLPSELQQKDFEHLVLGRNQLTCDCHSKWVKYWVLSNRDIIEDMDDILCVTGKSAGKKLVEITDDDYVCEIPQKWSIAITVAVFILLLIAIAAIVFKFRNHAKLFMFVRFNWHPFDKGDEALVSKSYDAFVSYSAIDSNWVMRVLCRKLEPRYRLCLRGRDFTAGQTVQQNIGDAIRGSQRMLVILSKNYVQSDWCLEEFRSARSVMKDGSILVIRCSNITAVSLNDDLQVYLRSNAFLEVTDKSFWEKLLYKMPHNSQHSAEGNGVNNSAMTMTPAAEQSSPLVLTAEGHQATKMSGVSPLINPDAASETIHQSAAHVLTQPGQTMAKPPVVLMSCPPCQAEGQVTTVAYTPCQMTLASPWPAKNYVQENGDILYHANGYTPFPGFFEKQYVNSGYAI